LDVRVITWGNFERGVPQNPSTTATKQPTQQRKHSRRDCILAAAGKYLTNERVIGFKRTAANAILGTFAVTTFYLWGIVGATGAALEAGEITAVDAGIEALHTSTHVGIHGVTWAAATAYWGYTFKESYQNNKDFRRAVDACPKQ